MPSSDPATRTLIAKIGANASWANTTDRAARTAKAREAVLNAFERRVDPDGLLTPAERAQRATYARKAHMHKLALASSKARKAQ